MSRPAGSLLSDMVLFVLSTAVSHGTSLVRRSRQRWRLRRRLLGTHDDVGPVVAHQVVQAPLSDRRVAACRLVVEQRLDDGSWAVIFDEVQNGELDVVGAGGSLALEGPFDLVLPPAGEFGGASVGRLLRGQLPADDEDIRATEYLLAVGQQVHLLGLAKPGGTPPAGGPYRDALRTVAAGWRGRPICSAWSRRELLGLLWHDPDRLPPDLRGAGVRR